MVFKDARETWRRRQERRRLRKADLEKAEAIPRKGEKILARVVNIYDGDTLTVAYMWGKQVYRTTIRVYGIDAPELRGKGVTELEKKAGLLVREYVKTLLEGEVYITLLRHDKYGGRVIGRVSYDSHDSPRGEEQDLSDHLLSMGAVKAYMGKKKEIWSAKELKTIVYVLGALLPE